MGAITAAISSLVSRFCAAGWLQRPPLPSPGVEAVCLIAHWASSTALCAALYRAYFLLTPAAAEAVEEAAEGADAGSAVFRRDPFPTTDVSDVPGVSSATDVPGDVLRPANGGVISAREGVSPEAKAGSAASSAPVENTLSAAGGVTIEQAAGGGTLESAAGGVTLECDCDPPTSTSESPAGNPTSASGDRPPPSLSHSLLASLSMKGSYQTGW